MILLDNELLKRIRKGDGNAFSVLYKENSEYALRVAMAVTGSSALAADAVQETFIRVYKNINSFEQGRSFKAWMYRILLNECNRLLKKKNRTVFMNDQFSDYNELAHEEIHDFEEYEELYGAIQRLPEINKIPIILKYLKGFSEKEIAEVLQINVNTVKSRLLRGRQKLKEFLEEGRGRGINYGSGKN